MNLIIGRDGVVRGVYGEEIDLATVLGFDQPRIVDVVAVELDLRTTTISLDRAVALIVDMRALENHLAMVFGLDQA